MIKATGFIALALSAGWLSGCGSTPQQLVTGPRVTVITRTLRTLPPEATMAETQDPAANPSGSPAVTPAPIGPDPLTTVPPPSATGTPANTAFCTSVHRYNASVNQLTAQPDAAELQQLVVDVTNFIEQAAASAPEAIKAETTVVAGAHRRFLNALEAADFNPALLAPGEQDGLRSGPYLAAKARVSDFSRQNCPNP